MGSIPASRTNHLNRINSLAMAVPCGAALVLLPFIHERTMAISAKGKRRITVNERVYLWRVFESYDQGWFDGVQVTIAATDQNLFLRYGLRQPDESRTAVISRGRGTSEVRIACPRWEGEGGVFTPQVVRDLIDWGLAVAL